MRTRRLCCILLAGLVSAVATAQTSRTPQIIQSVLREPIPAAVLDHARQTDDQIMQHGMVDGTRVYLVTDARLARVDAIVGKLLTAMGQQRQQWQVRVLDTKPAVSNAFVTGGRYIYVFTGFLDKAQSDDEIAFVLGHEIGHSMLKHGLREEQDPWVQLAKVVSLIGAAKGPESGSTLATVGAGLQAKHSQADELEADAIGMAIAWRAGYNAIRGADFFTRSVRSSDEIWSEAGQLLEQLRTEALQTRAKCEQLLAAWNAARIERSAHNQNVVNAACADAEKRRVAYNDFNSRYAIGKSQEQLNKLTSTHPEPQARISAITSGLDALEDRRDTDSIKVFPNLYNVLMGLYLERSILLERPAPATAATTKPRSDNDSSLVSRLTQLQEALDAGLITQAEYDSRRKEILGRL